ncbi:hypothetical protein KDL01_29265 [Actinospica durhamensis]|uniref:Pycsar effector protein domain-containing protein n=1 Tax=Actinospica durhamensis TaxID=1508375 RepID=A0A941IQ95_9ACTN|nr:Pycsar system effector family protein [Actinospica durhamensis]MBR7837405.1 hypothetical protein [Actinospica durhamensis]
MPAPNPSGAAASPLPALRYLIDQAEHAIDRADSKATALGAASIAVFAVLNPRQSLHHGATAAMLNALLIVGRICWVVAVLALAAAVKPRLRPVSPGPHAVSFLDLSEKFDAERLRSLVRRAGDTDDWLLVQAHVLGRIALAKFRLIQLGMALLTFSGLTGALVAMTLR